MRMDLMSLLGVVGVSSPYNVKSTPTIGEEQWQSVL